MSNDGVIALDIDDRRTDARRAGNDLLLACYGRRFTLEIRTQVATAKGEMRELRNRRSTAKMASQERGPAGGGLAGLDQQVPDPRDRALARRTQRSSWHAVLRQADGPLDPDRKRMFMDMKREVIRLGGYQREFFVADAGTRRWRTRSSTWTASCWRRRRQA